MRAFRLRTDIQRVVLDGFALPLGLDPGWSQPPTEGYTVAYNVGEDDEPDTYAFHAVVSHDKLQALVDKAFALLPDEVYAILEVGSRDAYRAIDVFLGREAVTRDEFLAGWKAFESFLLEDGAIAAGANAEEPFLEVFLDQWKGLGIHAPVDLRDDIEQMLHAFGLREVSQTWPVTFDDNGYPEIPPDQETTGTVRPVLLIEDEYSPDVDELLLELRHQWQLELNLDPNTNTDEAGRELGWTLWHAVVILEENAQQPQKGAYMSIWATASSMAEMLGLIEDTLGRMNEWRYTEIYTIDRVAFDERPDELASLSPRRHKGEVHLVSLDEWDADNAKLGTGHESNDE